MPSPPSPTNSVSSRINWELFSSQRSQPNQRHQEIPRNPRNNLPAPRPREDTPRPGTHGGNRLANRRGGWQGRANPRRSQIFAIGGSNHWGTVIQGLVRHVARLQRAMRTTTNLYYVLREEHKRDKLQTMTLAVIVRRLSGDLQDAEKKVEGLEMARLYMKDRLDNQVETIESLQKQVDELNEKSRDQRDYGFAKDARIRVVRETAEQIKSDLAWGKFSGTSDELDKLFDKLFILL